jgi:hypothetical protein
MMVLWMSTSGGKCCAPRPVLLSGLRTFVAFYLSGRDPLSGGPGAGESEPHPDHGIGIVEFKMVTSVKIGSPNDEVLHGHPLWGSGLEFYAAHEVKNSSWLAELREVNRVHGSFDESRWTGTRHFILTFHDETLECLAKWTATRTAPGATMPEVLARLTAEALLFRSAGQLAQRPRTARQALHQAGR